MPTSFDLLASSTRKTERIGGLEMPFSAGARVRAHGALKLTRFAALMKSGMYSVGRQLAMVELVAALCTLVSRYEITLSSTAFVNEGVEARRARILDSSVGVVLTIKRPVALVFTKR